MPWGQWGGHVGTEGRRDWMLLGEGCGVWSQAVATGGPLRRRGVLPLAPQGLGRVGAGAAESCSRHVPFSAGPLSSCSVRGQISGQQTWAQAGLFHQITEAPAQWAMVPLLTAPPGLGSRAPGRLAGAVPHEQEEGLGS